jgi:O-antigen/teichoic acid export membrane protein
MVLFVVPAGRPESSATTRFPGLRLLTIGLGIMLVALAGVASPWSAVGLLACAAILLVAAVWLDGRSRDRLMPRDAFRPVSVVGTGLCMTLLINVAGAGSAVYLVLVVQRIWSMGPTFAGAIAAVLAVAWSASAVIVANVRHKQTRKALIRSGPALIASGLILVMIGLQLDQLACVIGGQLVIGAGFGTCNGYLNLTMMEAASDSERDRTSVMPSAQHWRV